MLARHQDIFGEQSGFVIEPIPVDEAVSSLSSIIMDDDYYDFTLVNSSVENGLRIASSIALIALKAKAYLNLVSEKEHGRQVNTKDIKKHRSDVLKLVATTEINEPVSVTTNIHHCIMEFADSIRTQLPSQSLEAALGRSSSDIAIFVEILEGLFIEE